MSLAVLMQFPILSLHISKSSMTMKSIDKTYLFACVFWGLTTALMLYVKLKKKTDAFPVLILVLISLLYMNSSDLFKSFRLFNVACVYRKINAHQFLTSLILGFTLNAFKNPIAITLLLLSILARGQFETSKTGIPLIGSFLVSPKRTSLIMLGLATQAFGFFTGTLLSIAMISDSSEKESNIRIPLPIDPFQYRIVSVYVVGLIVSNFITTPSIKGKVQTFFASGFLASLSRVIPLVSNPVAIMPFFTLISFVFPAAVTSLSCFIPLLLQKSPSTLSKLKMFLTVMFWHFSGALSGGILSNTIDVGNFDFPYVSKKAIAHEFFFACVCAFVVTRKPNLAVLVFTAAFLETAGNDIVHISSSISLGANQLSNGRLAARLIWQTAGALFGSTLMASFTDSETINFDAITSVTRTTEGKLIRVTGK